MESDFFEKFRITFKVCVHSIKGGGGQPNVDRRGQGEKGGGGSQKSLKMCGYPLWMVRVGI